MAKVFLVSATSEFLNLQSGNARPFFYVEAIISGNTSVIGNSYTSTNFLLDGGTIDRIKPILPGQRSRLVMSDVTIKVDNGTQRFSPEFTGSVFFDNDYLKSPVNYWAGFENVSGTALLLQRGAFLLDVQRIDTKKNIAFMRLRDKFIEPLSISIGRGASGTAIPLVFTGGQNAQVVMESLLITGAGLTAGDIDIQTATTSFNNLSLDEQTIANALANIAEASDGFIYTSRKGTVKFVSQAPVFGTATAAFNINDSGHYSNLFYEQDINHRISKVIVDFASGLSSTVISESPTQTAQVKVIKNELIENTGDAIAISSRFLDRFSGQVTELEVPAVWMPSLDIGDKISVVNANAGLTGSLFEIFSFKEQITRGTMTMKLLTDRSSNQFGKFGFWSSETEPQSGTIFTGATGEAQGWQAGWLFWSRDTGTAVNPGFDADGNNNNVIESGVTSSGAGGTGIEVPFGFY